MTNDQLLKFLRQNGALGGSLDSKILVHDLKSKLDEPVNDEIIYHLSEALRVEVAARTVEHNRIISKSIEYLVNSGNWTSISQILRALPEDLLNAIESDLCSDYFSLQIISDFTKDVQAFLNLDRDGRKKALQAAGVE